MLLAGELALVALKPESGRSQLGTGDALNACLAGLLVAELLLEGSVAPGERADRIVAVPGGEVPGSPALAAALEVVAPERRTRKHARNRIDHALDGSDLEPVGKIVRRLIQEAAEVAAATAAIDGVAATGS